MLLKISILFILLKSFGLNNAILETKENEISAHLVRKKRQSMIQSLNRLIFTNKKEEKPIEQKLYSEK